MQDFSVAMILFSLNSEVHIKAECPSLELLRIWYSKLEKVLNTFAHFKDAKAEKENLCHPAW